MIIMKANLRYVGIRVKDLQRSIQFYTKLLDMKIKIRTKSDYIKGETANLTAEEGALSWN